MALDMRALYYVALPTERSEADDVQRHEDDIKANENCLNQNDYFSPRTNQFLHLNAGSDMPSQKAEMLRPH